MKAQNKIKLAALALAVTTFAPALHAQLTLPTTDVSDGALNVTGVTNIDLRNAITVSSWTNSNAATNAGNGVYDPAQWAVVFKYSSVNIASNGTVNFINNITHAPVVWVVNGNVTINGTVNLDGLAGNNSDQNNLTEPGPGGFRGGGSPALGYGQDLGPAVVRAKMCLAPMREYMVTRKYSRSSAVLAELVTGMGIMAVAVAGPS